MGVLQGKQGGCKSTDAETAPSPTETVDQDADVVLDVDVAAWRASIDKLTLRETGELVRSLVRAKKSQRPNREQRILLAIFTRPPKAEAVT